MEEKMPPGKRFRPWWWLLGVVVSLLVLGSALFLTLQL
jgi:cytochrome c-type biogenesis protein CcmH/NrfG